MFTAASADAKASSEMKLIETYFKDNYMEDIKNLVNMKDMTWSICKEVCKYIYFA